MIGVASCSSADLIGSTAEATTVTPLTSTSQFIATNPTNPYQNDEPSCVWSPPNGTNRLGVWACGFNDNNTNRLPHGTPATNVMGWSSSADNTKTWRYCNTFSTGCGFPPFVSGMTAWGGDPALAADGEGNVAYIALAANDANMTNTALVVAALSTDGGQTFTNTVQVNEPFPNQPCYPGTEDQASADFDITTPSTSARKLSVVWRHLGGGGYGACMRRGTFCAAATSDPACSGLGTYPNIAWETATGLDVQHMHRDNSLYGQSAVIVQAGDGAVAVVYADCDHSMVECPDTSTHTCGWHSVVTFDGGNDWTADSTGSTVDYTTTMKNCVVNGGSPPNGGQIEARHRATFAFTRNRRNGDYYVATAHGQGDLRLFRSQNQGTSWTQVNQFTNGSVPTITYPVLASDSAGRLALEFIQSDPPDALVQPVLATVVFDPTPANPSPAPPTNAWAFNAPTIFFPTPSGQVRAIGDYNSIGVMDPVVQANCAPESRFVPAWTDTLGPNTFNVHVQEFDVTP